MAIACIDAQTADDTSMAPNAKVKWHAIWRSGTGCSSSGLALGLPGSASPSDMGKQMGKEIHVRVPTFLGSVENVFELDQFHKYYGDETE